MSNSREVSQFSNFIVVDDSNRNIGIATTATPYVGIGTDNPTSKLHVVGDARITGVVTAASFTGNLTGTATTATNITIATTPSDTTTYPVFVATSSAGNQAPFVDSSISWDAISDILSVPTIQVSTGIDLYDSNYIYFGSSDDVKVFYDGTANDLEIELESSANKIAITENGTYKHQITKTGVGINVGTTALREELDVVGDIGVQASGASNRFVIQHNNSLNSLDFIFV